MFIKDKACFLFLDSQDEVIPSISSSVVLCFFVLLVYNVALVLVFCLCPSSVRVVATFPGIVFISFTVFCAPIFSLTYWFFSLSSFVIPKECRSRGIKMAAPPLHSPCDGPITYPGDIKTLVKSSKEEADRHSLVQNINPYEPNVVYIWSTYSWCF